MLEISKDKIYVSRDIGEDWFILGRQDIVVSYHPDWEAKAEVHVGANKKGDTIVGYRLLVLLVDAPYKKDIYHEAIMYSIADKFRRSLWADQPSHSTSLGSGSLMRRCEID